MIRPHTQDEIGKPFQKQYTLLPREVKYPRCSLDENITPDAMGSRLEADILKKIPKRCIGNVRVRSSNDTPEAINTLNYPSD